MAPQLFLYLHNLCSFCNFNNLQSPQKSVVLFWQNDIQFRKEAVKGTEGWWCNIFSFYLEPCAIFCPRFHYQVSVEAVCPLSDSHFHRNAFQLLLKLRARWGNPSCMLWIYPEIPSQVNLPGRPPKRGTARASRSDTQMTPTGSFWCEGAAGVVGAPSRCHSSFPYLHSWASPPYRGNIVLALPSVVWFFLVPTQSVWPKVMGWI